MSADLWLEIDTGSTEPARVTESINVTYNLTPMLTAAGYPGHQQMRGVLAAEAGGIFRQVGERLRADPSKYDEFVPDNGWGSLDGAAKFCEEMAAACAKHPRAIIGGWL